MAETILTEFPLENHSELSEELLEFNYSILCYYHATRWLLRVKEVILHDDQRDMRYYWEVTQFLNYITD